MSNTDNSYGLQEKRALCPICKQTFYTLNAMLKHHSETHLKRAYTKRNLHREWSDTHSKV